MFSPGLFNELFAAGNGLLENLGGIQRGIDLIFWCVDDEFVRLLDGVSFSAAGEFNGGQMLDLLR